MSKYHRGGHRLELSSNSNFNTHSNFRVDISKHGEPDPKKREQFKKDQKKEEDRIRSMKKSHDYRKWAFLSHEIDKKFWELAELKEKERQLEDKLMMDYNIKIYTKYGLSFVVQLSFSMLVRKTICNLSCMTFNLIASF